MMTQTLTTGSAAEAVDRKVRSIAGALSVLPQLDCPLKHSFIPGFYVRQILMPKGALIVSRKHKTEHPFVITKGRAAVWDAVNGVQQLQAPHCGITQPGTQRILFIHEDCEWTTFHAGDWPAATDPDEIVAELTEPQDLITATADVLKALEAIRPGVNV